MTSAAMIAGMMPAALGIGGVDRYQSDMADAVIGGLITSTALTLVMVPAVFTWIDDLERWLGRLLLRGVLNPENRTAVVMPPSEPVTDSQHA
jgi:hypothetical protein